jgi:hypothetical protein
MTSVASAPKGTVRRAKPALFTESVLSVHTQTSTFAPQLLGSACAREVAVSIKSRASTQPLHQDLPIVHDVRLRREQMLDGSSRVIAEIDCARKGQPMAVEDCANCARFVRIDTHEAGYVVLCHDKDSDAPRYAGETHPASEP